MLQNKRLNYDAIGQNSIADQHPLALLRAFLINSSLEWRLKAARRNQIHLRALLQGWRNPASLALAP
jgi:hypothetical protein